MYRRPNLVLIGFMASGKSTVGRACARKLELRFRDSDTFIERRAGKPISDIFAEEGEDAFRKMEMNAIRTLSSNPPIVLSTGGGAVLNPINVARLRRNGLVVLLWSKPEAIAERVRDPARRPLLADAADPATRIQELLSQREPAYRAAAHVVVDTSDMTRDETVVRVVEIYQDHCSGRRGGR